MLIRIKVNISPCFITPVIAQIIYNCFYHLFNTLFIKFCYLMRIAMFISLCQEILIADFC